MLNHPLISVAMNEPLNSVACETACAKRSMSGASLCSGMLGTAPIPSQLGVKGSDGRYY